MDNTRHTFADLTGRAGQPMDYDGDFDDDFTAEDYERRRYETEMRRQRFATYRRLRDGW